MGKCFWSASNAQMYVGKVYLIGGYTVPKISISYLHYKVRILRFTPQHVPCDLSLMLTKWLILTLWIICHVVGTSCRHCMPTKMKLLTFGNCSLTLTMCTNLNKARLNLQKMWDAVQKTFQTFATKMRLLTCFRKCSHHYPISTN